MYRLSTYCLQYDLRVRLATGTLYTALDRLLTADGHVQLVSEETVGGRIRRSHWLTEDGAAARRAEARRMAEAARIVTHPETKTVAGLSGRKPRTV